MTKQTFADFDFDSVQIERTELILRLSGDRGYRFAILDEPVREHLVEVLQSTKVKYDLDLEKDWDEWDYSNDSQSTVELLYPWLEEGLAEGSFLRDPGILDRANNIEEIAEHANAYFVRFFDAEDNMLVAAKDSQAFKSLRKKKVAFFSDGRLELVDNQLFQIANDFTCIFDSQDVFVFNATAFEKIVNLEEQLISGIDGNVNAFFAGCVGISWSGFRDFAHRYKKAAKYLRSIIRRGEYGSFDLDKIKSALDKKGIPYITHATGEIEPSPGHELVFVRLLDHSVYDVELSDRPTTAYVASGRSKLR